MGPLDGAVAGQLGGISTLAFPANDLSRMFLTAPVGHGLGLMGLALLSRPI